MSDVTVSTVSNQAVWSFHNVILYGRSTAYQTVVTQKLYHGSDYQKDTSYLTHMSELWGIVLWTKLIPINNYKENTNAPHSAQRHNGVFLFKELGDCNEQNFRDLSIYISICKQALFTYR